MTCLCLRPCSGIFREVLEGGGVRGFAYAGAFEVLDSLQVLKGIERVGGTSAGAIQACLLSVGYTPREILELTAYVKPQAFNDGSWFFGTGMHRLKKEFGLRIFSYEQYPHIIH